MLTATEALVGGDLTVSAPLIEAIPECFAETEWHRLRLFGRGRRPGVFDAGVETRDQL
jgi:hypothetical protein